MDAVISIRDLPGSEVSRRFEGHLFGEVGSSMFLVDYPRAGMGPKLHLHPYSEVFIVQAGEALFTVGDEEVAVAAGQIAIVQPRTPHKFVSVGEGALRMVTVQATAAMETEWLEE